MMMCLPSEHELSLFVTFGAWAFGELKMHFKNLRNSQPIDRPGHPGAMSGLDVPRF